MKLNKKIILGMAALSVAGFAFAQDFGDFDDWGGDSSSSEFGGSSSSGVTIGGSVEMAGRVYVDQWDTEDNKYPIQDLPTDARPSAKLNFEYEGANTDFTLVTKFDKNSLGDYKWDMLDEFTARVYLGNLQVEAGKMRVVWGKCDKLHVLDNFNANDYTDYIIPDYIDRRIAEPMFRVVYATPSNIRVEGVYTPVMTADRLGSGRWEPLAAKTLQNTVTNLAKSEYAKLVADAEDARVLTAKLLDAGTDSTKIEAIVTNDGEKLTKYGLNTGNISGTIGTAAKNYLNSAVAAQNAALMNLSSLSSDSSIMYPDTYQLKYGQFGVRSTFTVGSVDLGFSYYYGHSKQPSFDVVAFQKAIPNYVKTGSLPEADKFLSYDKLNIFGFEGATIIGRFNTRWEFAYDMTDDLAGDDPAIHNNSLNWVAGFDCDLPIHNVNFNIQTQGKYILKGNEINDSKFKAFDVDNDPNDCYTNNKIVLDITDSWNLEKIKLDVKGIWGIERTDLILMPTLTFKLKDDFTMNLSGMYIWSKDSDSEFWGWEDNSFGQISCKYQF